MTKRRVGHASYVPAHLRSNIGRFFLIQSKVQGSGVVSFFVNSYSLGDKRNKLYDSPVEKRKSILKEQNLESQWLNAHVFLKHSTTQKSCIYPYFHIMFSLKIIQSKPHSDLGCQSYIDDQLITTCLICIQIYELTYIIIW